PREHRRRPRTGMVGSTAVLATRPEEPGRGLVFHQPGRPGEDRRQFEVRRPEAAIRLTRPGAGAMKEDKITIKYADGREIHPDLDLDLIRREPLGDYPPENPTHSDAVLCFHPEPPRYWMDCYPFVRLPDGRLRWAGGGVGPSLPPSRMKDERVNWGI